MSSATQAISEPIFSQKRGELRFGFVSHTMVSEEKKKKLRKSSDILAAFSVFCSFFSLSNWFFGA